MRRRAVALIALYALALLASHAVRRARGDPAAPLAPDQRVASVPAVDFAAPVPADAPRVRIAYRELGPSGAPVLLLLHGNPGRGADLLGLARRLATGLRVIVPDLPGFGASTRRLPDHSIRAQGAHLRALLDAFGVARAHVAGFSMGGGVALELGAQAPERVASLALVASIGAQEFELLGDPRLNRLVHALQLAAIAAAEEGLPHFGALDRWPLDRAYARTFLDTDQGRLRPILERWSGPLLLVHGARDPLVPVGAAREHHRLVPQSELVVLEAGHLLPWRQADAVAGLVGDFVARVEAGRAPTRASADAERVARAALPFDASRAGPQGPLGLAAFALLVLAASMVSEDLTCIGVGLLTGSGQVGLGLGIAACAFALWAGDLLLYLAGRFVAPGLLRRTLLRRAARADGVARSESQLRRAGPWLILGSRFVPGSRLPTYVAAGALRYPIASFSLWLAVGALLWAPLLVGGAAQLGGLAFGRFEAFERRALPVALAVAAIVLALARIGPALATHRGRRLLVGAWRRWRHWEFWPIWMLYAPVVPWIAWLALRHRSVRVVTAVNPAMPAGGLVGESKRAILEPLAAAAPDAVARTRFVPAGAPPEVRAAAVRAFLREAGLGFPIVLKPDVGERGHGVSVIRSDAAIDLYLEMHPEDLLAQEYVPGREFGLFYARRPSEPRGRLLSITDKRMIAVRGDGRRTLEELILRDARAVCLAPVHLARHAAALARVPAVGEEVALVELGTHSRGALFLDGAWLETPELAAAIDDVSRGFPGFFFGRYDVRSESVEELRKGRGFRILELNGLAAEATHVYDPRYGLLDAWRVLFAQWRLAFEIGAANRAAGARPASWSELRALWRARAR